MNDDINKRLDELITLFGMSRTSFAHKVGVSVASLSNLLGGRNSKPSYEMLYKFASNLPQLNIEWLLFGIGQAFKTPGNTDPACWDLLRREEEQHNKLREDYNFLKAQLRELKATNVLKELDADEARRLGIS